MKIERLNENQIRCTLTREDLADRKLKLSELAYGSEKAKDLFRELMQMAAYECGFEANDIPLMIEAIPMSPDTLVLIITKVEDPEELDTRFAKFAPSGSDGSLDVDTSFSPLKLEGADDILNLFQKIREAHKALTGQKSESSASNPSESSEETEEEPVVELKKLYAFHQLDDVIHTANVVKGSYDGQNTLYKNPGNGEYQLLVSKSGHTPEEFNRVCNMISEYGDSLKCNAGTEAFLLEHGQVIVANDALQKLTLL
ncbi:MAG: adaptor protein MecA [Muricoprocola sp.]